MEEPAVHRRLLAVLLLAGALRSLFVAVEEPPADLLLPATGAPTALPALATADRIRLAWLPGIGRGRAARLVELRAHLGVPLTAPLLDLLPGFGPGTAAEVQAWYRRRGVPEGGTEP